MQFMKLGSAVAACAMLLVAACSEHQAPTVSAIPEHYWGRYRGVLPASEVKDRDGSVIRFRGKTRRVPAVRNDVAIDARSIAWQQERLEDGGRRTVYYDRATPAILEDTKDHLLVECSFPASASRINPTRRFRFDHADRTVTLLGERRSTDCRLHPEPPPERPSSLAAGLRAQR